MIQIHENMSGPGIRPRDVQVWVPPGYGDHGPLSEKRYPVLYMHDGQNVFNPRTSTLGIAWEADRTAERLISEGGMKDIIIVAVNHTPDRMAEYSDSPKGRNYMCFIVEVLKPFIDRNYRTDPVRNFCAVLGSSMGGLISLLLAWKFTDIFGMAGCLSPVFVIDDTNVLPLIRDNPKPQVKIYVDNGGLGLDHRLQIGCDLTVSELIFKGFIRGKDLEWYFDREDDHSEEAWRKRLWRPLLFFFGE
jgi:predicted alpha/beta superfamily hydrolase